MNAKVKAARLSMFSNSALVLGKLSIGWMIGSISVISEGVHSALDLVAAVIAFYAVRAASQPADYEHPYGHGKIENLSGTIEALLILGAGIWIIYEAMMRLWAPQPVEGPGWGMAVMALSAVVNYFISNYLLKVSKETDSVALQADALHLRTDVYTSAGVVAGLGLVWLTGWHWLDAASAIVVAVLILHAAWELTREAFMPLLDTRLPEEEERAIRAIIETFKGEFLEYHGFRARKAGSERHVDLHLVFYRSSTVEEIHRVTLGIIQAVKAAYPGSTVLIHTEPCKRECATCPRYPKAAGGE